MNFFRLLPLALLLALPSTASAAPIPDLMGTSLEHYQGAPATAHSIPATKAPQNPFMAPNPKSNIHNDTWMTDAYQWAGPLGKDPTAFSGSMPPALCGSLTFDSNGHIVSVCPSLVAPPTVRVIDPDTLEILSTFTMPTNTDPPGQRQYQNFAGGGYFFLDKKNRIWSATKTSHLFVLQVSDDGRSVEQLDDYDLTSVLESDERITSALPDFKGRIWFVSKRNGKVGILNTKTRKVEAIRLGEDVQNSFTIDTDGVYIVSSKRMYRFRAKNGKPVVDWKVRYKNTGVEKQGQADAGSGTTPTIMKGGYIAITDNADPMNVVVYRTARKLGKGQKRTVCEVPVFEKGKSATENSLMTAGRALFVENNYGYQDPFGPNTGALTEPGFARVDLKKSGKGCKKVWTNTTERAPTVVPKLSTKTGLIYTYTRDDDPQGGQPYFWTAIDARNGKTAFKVYAGNGLGFNNNYAGIAIGPNGTAYLGVTGGIVALRDA
jgi:hypothetical protein